MRQLTYEFVVPSGVFLVDNSAWDPLAVIRGDLPMQVRKPVSSQKFVGVAETIGNQGIDLHYTVMRVDLEIEDNQPNPEWSVPFQAVTECLNWIRVVGRQYLVGGLKSGTNNVARGSIISGPDNYTNFGAFQSPIVVLPLSREMWKWIGDEMASCNVPTIPDLMFCDALLSVHDRDYLQAVILLGVTSELELNAFIDDLLVIQNHPLQKLYDERRYKFEWKLKNIPEIMGAERYQQHNPRWTDQLCKLYELRGQAVHRAECLMDDVDEKTGKKQKVGIGFRQVSTFIFAVDDFLRWTKGQRNRLGLRTARIFDSPIKAMIGS
jgi:hypothetical protein